MAAMHTASHPIADHPPIPARASLATMALGSIGVVYGDIGTSPLYALKESLTAAAEGGTVTEPMVLGVMSLVLWTLIVVVTLKYVLLIMSMDNDGEGGTLTLMALVQRVMGHRVRVVVLLGMAGAALFYGDAVITPAISVLSAVEGLKLFAPDLDPWIVPISSVILILLFAAQSRGTASVAVVFGPIMVIWFGAIAFAGAIQVAAAPGILRALSPTYGVQFLASHGVAGLVALGAVFLAVTGAEALYADMGHFGSRPIRVAWLSFVLPSLALCYLGQGALLIARPEAIENPFYLLFPSWGLLPMVVLATAATIIASQAVITGAFSITHQAIQLGLLPRTHIRRTSETEKGQIYVPQVNALVLMAVLFLVYAFKSSSALASAYGIAVTGTMVVTAILAFFVMTRVWGWSAGKAALVIVPFLVIDLVFLGANLLKLFDGGWLPLSIGLMLMLVMMTWRRGAQILAEKARRSEVELGSFIASLEKRPPVRAKGVAVFLTGDPGHVPTSLLHNLKHNKVLHEKNVILTVEVEDVPRLDPAHRCTCERISEAFSVVTLRFGFMEDPDVARALPGCKALDWAFNVMNTSFFISRRVLRTAPQSRMPRWQEKLFIRLARNASDASDHFGIPSGRTIEVGSQVSV